MRTSTRVLASAALCALALTGCTNDTEPENGQTPTEGPTETTTEDPGPADRSSEILSFTMNEEPLAETSGRWDAQVTVGMTRPEVRMRVYAVDAYPSTTHLTFDVLVTEGGALSPFLRMYWNDFPRLVIDGEDQAHFANQYRIDEGDTPVRGVYSMTTGQHGDFAPVRSQYPPLPAGTTEVTISTPGLEEMTVPVTWHGS